MSKGNNGNNYFTVTEEMLSSPPEEFICSVNSYFECSNYEENIGKMKALATDQRLTGVCFIKDEEMRFIDRHYSARNEMVLSFCGTNSTSTVIVTG